MSEVKDIFLVCSAHHTQEPHASKYNALKVFQAVVANGGWCEVWKGTEGVHAVTKIADFPGLVYEAHGEEADTMGADRRYRGSQSRYFVDERGRPT